MPANIHSIQISGAQTSPLDGHLHMGGGTSSGEWIGANSLYLTRNAKPWTPVMGEIHFSRIPRDTWRNALLKLKAGGIQIAATYIFWNYHEETQGTFDWSENRDLRAFISLCAETGLLAYPRIGPWAHGEARLGGFPDWLLEKCARDTRRDAPQYLGYAKILYQQIADQLSGLLWKDGGPVVGIQIENELCDQPAHLRTLKHMAREAGLAVPIYTMTGWGPAQVPEDELIPVFGGYPDAPWDRQVANWARDSRKHYFFSALRDDNTIGADLGRKPSVPDQGYLDRYPYGTCELGGGVQVTYHRRPWIKPQDAAVIPFCKLGAGANMLGYYMYHGGTHPLGSCSTLQESQDSGYPNDLPVRSYDFQAPLGEYGQVREHFHSLRTLHLFMQDFGAEMACLKPTFPAQSPANLDDRTTLRFAVRSDGHKGFLFANNYQRLEPLAGHTDVQFELQLEAETLLIPDKAISIQPGEHLLWPFNLETDGLRLAYASANLVCRLEENGHICLVMTTNQGIAPELAFPSGEVASFTGASCETCETRGLIIFSALTPGPDCLLEVTSPSGTVLRILLLDHTQGRMLSKIQLWGSERLLLSPALLLQDGNNLRIRATNPDDLWFAVFPSIDGKLTASAHLQETGPFGIFTSYRAQVAARSIPVTARKIASAHPAPPIRIGPAGVAQAPSDADFIHAEVWEVKIPDDALDGTTEVYLQICYTADVARAYIEGELVADDFWYGRTWEIGIRRFAPKILQQGLRLKFLPLRSDAPIYIPPEQIPVYGPDGQALQVGPISALQEYEIQIQIQQENK